MRPYFAKVAIGTGDGVRTCIYVQIYIYMYEGFRSERFQITVRHSPHQISFNDLEKPAIIKRPISEIFGWLRSSKKSENLIKICPQGLQYAVFYSIKYVILVGDIIYMLVYLIYIGISYKMYPENMSPRSAIRGLLFY